MSEHSFPAEAKWWAAHWQRQRRALDAVRGCDNAILALGLYYHQVEERRVWRRYLRRFGFRILRRGRIYRLKRHRQRRLTRYGTCCVTWGFLGLARSNAVAEAVLRDGLPGACEVFEKMPLLQGYGMLLLPLPEQRDAAAASATGWAYSSLRVFPRMAANLPADEAGRLTELGTATALGFGEAAGGEDLAGILNRISGCWAGPGVPDGYELTTLDEEVTEDDAALREMAAGELRDLLASAGLSKREDEALWAWLNGETESEVANRMGVRVGTVRQFLARAKRKVRAVA